jgi:uncharacterized protein (DUF983 family)
MNKGTKLYSILHEKCPRCHEGDMFVAPFYSPKFSKMHEHCLHCGLRFAPEPSFFFGSMYVSYAFQVAIMVATYIGLRTTIQPETWVYITTSLVLTLVTVPISFRISRAVWINIFVSYEKSGSQSIS